MGFTYDTNGFFIAILDFIINICLLYYFWRLSLAKSIKNFARYPNK